MEKFNSKALKKKKKEKMETAKYEANPSLSAKLPSEVYKSPLIGAKTEGVYKSPLIGAKTAPMDLGKLKTSSIYKSNPSLSATVPSIYEPSLTGALSIHTKPVDWEAETGDKEKEEKKEIPQKKKPKKESAARMEALISAAAKKEVGKKKGEVIMFKEGKPASAKDEELLKKSKKAK